MLSAKFALFSEPETDCHEILPVHADRSSWEYSGQYWEGHRAGVEPSRDYDPSCTQYG